MNLIHQEQIKDVLEFNKRFSELSEQGQIMTLTYLSALHDKELADSIEQAAEQPRERKG